MNIERSGLLTLHTSIVLFGFTALFSKLIPLSAIDLNGYRSFIAAVTLLLLIKLKNGNWHLTSTKDTLWMVFLGVLMGAHWMTYFHAMQISSIAIGVISLYTFPLMIVFLEPLLRGEQLHTKDAVCALVGLFGVYLIVPDFSPNSPVAEGLIWGLVSALIFAFRNIWQKQHLSQYAGDTTMLYQALVAGLVCLPFMSTSISAVESESWIKLLVLGTVFTALPHGLFVASLRKLKAKTAGLISCLQPVYATTLAFLILKEEPALSTLLGGILIIGTAMYETYRAA